MEETLTSLSQELEAEYSPSTIYDNDLEDMHSTVHHWESDGGGKHTVMHLSLMRFEEQPDVLNLVMACMRFPKLRKNDETTTKHLAGSPAAAGLFAVAEKERAMRHVHLLINRPLGCAT